MRHLALILAWTTLWVACSADPLPVRSSGEACGEPAECESNLCYDAICFDTASDDDLDGLINEFEIGLLLNPKNPDTDGDGRWDALEVGSDLANPLDEDGDGVPDALESADPSADADGDCIPDQKDANEEEPEPSAVKAARPGQ